MKQYLRALEKVKKEGIERDDRTGVGTKGVFGYQMRFDISEKFPLLTTKKVFLRGIIHELLWFLSGSTNIKYLVDNDVHIWDEWPFESYLSEQGLKSEFLTYSSGWEEKKKEFITKIKEDDSFAEKWGDLGPVYGKQWRRWEGVNGIKIDQIQNAVDTIKNNPYSRRIIVSGWNVADIDGLVKGEKTAPPPCHLLFQFYVNDGKLSCQLYQRSADIFLGVPFNIASYTLFTMMVAQVCNLKPGEFVHTFGDLHIYKNHFEQVDLQLTREPRKLPIMKINSEVKDISSFKYEDFELEGYDPHPPIRAPIAV